MLISISKVCRLKDEPEYESQLEGLGYRFIDDFDRAIRRIVAYPYALTEIGDGLRRCLLTKFPYG